MSPQLSCGAEFQEGCPSVLMYKCFGTFILKRRRVLRLSPSPSLPCPAPWPRTGMSSAPPAPMGTAPWQCSGHPHVSLEMNAVGLPQALPTALPHSLAPSSRVTPWPGHPSLFPLGQDDSPHTPQHLLGGTNTGSTAGDGPRPPQPSEWHVP